MFRICIIFLELSLNSYLGILFIIIGLIVRIEFKIGIEKDIS